MKKVLLLSLIILISLTGWKVTTRFLAPEPDTTRRQQPKVPVEIAPVRVGTVRQFGSFTGSLKPKSRIIVSPKVTGRLEKIFVDIGDPIKPGQRLALLDNDESQQKLIQANAQLEVAKANLIASRDSFEYTKKEVQRVQSLRERNLVSDSELDTAKAKYAETNSKLQTAVAQLEEKKAALEVSRIQLSYAEIKNPWSDSKARLIVSERFMDEGALITPNGQLLSIIDISSLIAEISVPEKDYFKCQPGQLVTIEADALAGQHFKGYITRIAPFIEESSREAIVNIEINNQAERLRPGLFIRASILFETHQNVTLVPITAVVEREGVSGVFALDMTRLIARFISVQTGITENNLVEITHPEIQGFVVTLGHHLLEDGSPVVIPDHDSQNVTPPAKPYRLSMQTSSNP